MPLLDGHGARNRVDDTGEFDQCAITRRFNDATAMSSNRRVSQFAPMRFQGCQGPDLVGAHQPAIAHDIGRKNSSKSPLDCLILHVA